MWEATVEKKLQSTYSDEQIEKLDEIFKMWGDIRFNEPTAVVDPLQVAVVNVDTIADIASDKMSAYGDPEVGKKKKNRSVSDDFEVNLGKVQDVLRRDYPYLFMKSLDYSIYEPDIELADPTGINFQGIKPYRNLFTILRFCARNIFTSH